MILEFSQGTIKVIPGLDKSSITIHPDSTIEISVDGSITISAKTVAVSAVQDFNKYSDPAYLKTLGPITGQGIATTGYVQTVPSPGILMNQISDENKVYTGAMVSALDAGVNVRAEKLDVRTRKNDELLAHSGGLEKVGEEEEAKPVDYAAFVKGHAELAQHGGWDNAFPMWKDDPVAKLYKGTLKVPEHVVSKEKGAIALEGELNDYYSSAVLSDTNDEMRLFHSLQYLNAIGEDVEALLSGFGEEEVGPASSYMFALVQEHRRQLEAEREADIEANNAKVDVILKRSEKLLELTDRMLADPENSGQYQGEFEALYADVMSSLDGDEWKEPAGEEVLEPFYKPVSFGALPPDESVIGKTAAEIGHRNIAPTEKEYVEIPFEGAPLTEESVKAAIDALGLKDAVVEMAEGAMENKHVVSALDAMGIGHFAKFNDPVHGYRGIMEGLDTLVDRGIKTFNDYAKRSAK